MDLLVCLKIYIEFAIYLNFGMNLNKDKRLFPYMIAIHVLYISNRKSVYARTDFLLVGS